MLSESIVIFPFFRKQRRREIMNSNGTKIQKQINAMKPKMINLLLRMNFPIFEHVAEKSKNDVEQRNQIHLHSDPQMPAPSKIRIDSGSRHSSSNSPLGIISS